LSSIISKANNLSYLQVDYSNFIKSYSVHNYILHHIYLFFIGIHTQTFSV